MTQNADYVGHSHYWPTRNSPCVCGASYWSQDAEQHTPIAIGVGWTLDPEDEGWDQCSDCFDWLNGGVPLGDWPRLDEDFPGKGTMRDYHAAHIASPNGS